MPRFSIVDEKDIAEGRTTDIYFLRTEEILRKKKLNPRVVAEVGLYRSGDWGILCGVHDAAQLLENKPIDVYSMPEGTLFYPDEPVMRIEGRYLDFARYETPLLGLICHASGVATKAARVKLAAGDKKVVSFGTRRAHPVLAKMIERSAYIGGMDGVSNAAGAENIGIKASGTMPHSLIICFGDQKKAFLAFDEVMSGDVPRVCLCDTFADEKTEALTALEALGKRLSMVRLDTPSSRRGEFRRIIREVRWELDIRGAKNVGIFVSGGIDEKDIVELRDVVDGFGVGTSVSNAATIDFALDIVERDGKPCAKRGKFGGKKQVYRNWKTMKDKILLDRGRAQKAKALKGMEPLLKQLIKNGRIVEKFSVTEARNRVLGQIKKLAHG
jgi:nicotinate phosphoribosyltransferase